jgi:hypothetical protein
MAQPPANCGAAAGDLSPSFCREDVCQRFTSDRDSNRRLCGTAMGLGVDLVHSVSGAPAPCCSAIKVNAGRLGAARSLFGCAGMRG